MCYFQICLNFFSITFTSKVIIIMLNSSKLLYTSFLTISSYFSKCRFAASEGFSQIPLRMWCDHAKWVLPRKYWFWDIAKQQRKFPLFSEVLQNLQLLVSLGLINQAKCSIKRSTEFPQMESPIFTHHQVVKCCLFIYIF